VSHQPERAEKNCLNCGADVAGRYCQACGQENIVPHQSFRHLLQHFIFDLFHFDGKFFETLKFILFRPGRVPRAFISGKRISYLDPIRMYLFTSAIFFLIFSSFNKPHNSRGTVSGTLSRMERYDVASDFASRPSDSAARRLLPALLDSSLSVVFDKDTMEYPDSLIRYNGRIYSFVVKPKDSVRAHNFDIDFGNNWFGRMIRKRVDHFNERFEEDRKEANRAFQQDLLHRMPYLLFFSLPFFALLLKLMYLRRKQFFYADHLVFTLYHYIFNFILLLVMIIIARINTGGWMIGSLLIYALMLAGLFSLYKGMRNFYQQSRGRTIVKFLLVNLIGFFMFALLAVLFIFISAIQF
jgi:hypothetical protein